jgi:hypothetical protein
MSYSQKQSGPKIISGENLILYLDAANLKSYPGSGITWYDLSRYKNNVFPNTVVYNSTPPPSFFFNGFGTGYADISVPVSGINTITVEIWCKIITYNISIFFGWNLYAFILEAITNDGIGFNTGNDLYGYANFSSLNTINKWAHYVAVMNTGTYINNKIYVNANQLTGLSQLRGLQNTSNTNFNNGLGRINSWRSNTFYPVQADYVIFKMYNRELSQAEITQNYDTFKSRFGTY